MLQKGVKNDESGNLALLPDSAQSWCLLCLNNEIVAFMQETI